MKKGDFLLIALALLLAHSPLLLRPGQEAEGAAARAVVRKDGAVVAVLPLNEEAELPLNENGYNLLRVSGGAVCMAEADCPDGTCLRRGAVRRPGESIVCLPNRVTVVLEGSGGGVDAVTQ